MSANPIGTGPFKFVEFRPNEAIRVARNPEDWKPSPPYLDVIDWPTIEPKVSPSRARREARLPAESVLRALSPGLRARLPEGAEPET